MPKLKQKKKCELMYCNVHLLKVKQICHLKICFIFSMEQNLIHVAQLDKG
jgi:hypothetical protein